MRQLLFSVTSADMEWQFFRAGGKGGQNQNKRDSAARCIHAPSGAVGEARDERSQMQNRRLAFRRCVQTAKFQAWLKMEAARRMGTLVDIEAEVDKQMHTEKIRVEVQHDGKWQICESRDSSVGRAIDS